MKPHLTINPHIQISSWHCETIDIRNLENEDERNRSEVDGGSVANSEDEDEWSTNLANEDFISNLGPPGKRRKVDFKILSGRLI